MLESIPWWAYVIGGGLSIGFLLAAARFAVAIKGTNGSGTSLVGVLTELSTNIAANTVEVKAQTGVLNKMDRKLGKLSSIERTGKETSKSLKLAMTRQKRMYDKLERRKT